MTNLILEKIKSIRFHNEWIYTFLIGTYPVIGLIALNIIETGIVSSYRAIRMTIFILILVLVTTRAITRNWAKAALTTVFTSTMVFTYHHLINAIFENGWIIDRNDPKMLIIYLSVFYFGLVLINSTKKDLSLFTATLNIIAIVLILFPVYQIVSYNIYLQNTIDSMSFDVAGNELSIPKGQTPPDVYYIILDAFGREDSLKSIYDVNLYPFIDQLTEDGFFVARCSKSNYILTRYSLSSSLNMNYVEDLFSAGELEKASSNAVYTPLILNNDVANIFRELGYKIVAFETGWEWTELKDADYYLSPDSNPYIMNKFESLLIDNSLLSVFTKEYFPRAEIEKDKSPGGGRELHRARLLYILDSLAKLPKLPEQAPKFVFAHVVSPHRPFVFNPDGSFPKEGEDEFTGYKKQVKYISNRILEITEMIINDSETPPIIIIQGDHGPADSKGLNRYKILNAYYFPDNGDENLYHSITPINSFRLLFNTYFGGSFPILEDINWTSPKRDFKNFSLFEKTDLREECDSQTN